jgi:hypothetical protein
MYLKLFTLTILVLLLNGCGSDKKNVKNSNAAKAHPTKHEVVDTVKNKKITIVMKVVLGDQQIRDIKSYRGLGEAICDTHGKDTRLCQIVFTSDEAKNNFYTPNPQYSDDLYDNVAATFFKNGKKSGYTYSCFFVKGSDPSNCSTTSGNNLVRIAGEVKPFDYSSVDGTRYVGRSVYSNNHFKIKHYSASFDKMTDEEVTPSMYSMSIGYEVKASCVEGFPPVIKLSNKLADKGVTREVGSKDISDYLDSVTYRIDKASPKKIKQSKNSYIVTQKSLKLYEVILSPAESEDFINKIKNGNKLVIGKDAQKEVDLRGITKTWSKLISLCKVS